MKNRTLIRTAALAGLLAASVEASAQTATLQGRRLFLYDGGTAATINRIGLSSPDATSLTGNYNMILPTTLGNVNDILYLSNVSGTDGQMEFTNGSPLFWRVVGNDHTVTDNVNNLLGTLTNDPLRIITNNTTQVYISTAGLVGINQTTPGARLDIVENAATPGLLVTQTGSGVGISASSSGSIGIAGVTTMAGSAAVQGETGAMNANAVWGNAIGGQATAVWGQSLDGRAASFNVIGGTANAVDVDNDGTGAGIAITTATYGSGVPLNIYESVIERAGDIRVDVSATTNNLVLSNIATDAAVTDLLWINGSDQVRRTSLSGLVEQGITFNNEGGTTRIRLGGLTNTDNPFLANRFVNLDASTVSYTANGGADNVAVINGGANYGTTLNASATGSNDVNGTTNINTATAGATNIGTATGTNTVVGVTNVNVTGTDATSIGNAGSTVDINGGTNTVLGTTNINATGSSNTVIGNDGALTLNALTAGDLTANVTDGSTNLILNGITNQAPGATDEILWLQTSVGNEVRRTSFSTLVDEGLYYENNRFRLGGNAIDVNPVVSTRIVTVGVGGDLSFQTAGGANLMLGLADNGNVSLNTTGNGSTTIGSAAAGAISAQSLSTVDLIAGTTLNATGGTGFTATATTGDATLAATAGNVVLNGGTDVDINATANVTIDGVAITTTSSATTQVNAADVDVNATNNVTIDAVDITETSTGVHTVSAPTTNINTAIASTTNIGNTTNGIVNVAGNGNDGITITGTEAAAGDNTVVIDAGATTSNLVLRNIASVNPIEDMLWINGSDQVRRTPFSGTANEGIQFENSAYRLGSNAVDVNPIISGRIVTVGAAGTLTFTTATGANNMLVLNNNGDVALSATGAGLTTIGSATAGAVSLESSSTITATAGTTLDLNAADIDADATATIDLAAGTTFAATGATGASLTATANNATIGATAGNVVVNAGTDVDVNATGNVTVDGVAITTTSSATTQVNAADVDINATNAATIDGATVTTTATATNQINGATVDINGSTAATIDAPTIDLTGATTVTGTFTQGGAGNQVTLNGNVDATNGVDVTGANLTVGGTNFVVDVTNGNTDIAGNLTVNGTSTLGDGTGTDNIVANLGAAGTMTLTNGGAALTIDEDAITRAGAITVDQGANLLTLGNTGGTTTLAGVSGTPNITATSLASNSLPIMNPATDGIVIADGTGLLRRRPVSDLIDADQGLVYNETGTDFEVRLGSTTDGTNPITANRFVRVGGGGRLDFTTGSETMLRMNGANGNVQVALNGSGNVTVGGGTNNGTITLGNAANTGITLTSSATIAANGATVNVNTTGTGNTAIGNATGTFGLTSSQLNVNAANGELSDAVGAVTVNDADGLTINTNVAADLNITETTISRVGNIAINPGAGATVSTDGSLDVAVNLSVDGTTALGDGTGIDNTVIASGSGTLTVTGNGANINTTGSGSTAIGSTTNTGGVTIEALSNVVTNTGGTGTVFIQNSSNGDVVIGNTPQQNDLTLNTNVRGAGTNRFANKETIVGTGAANYTFNNTLVTAGSVILVTLQNYSGVGILSHEITTITAGLSFEVTFSAPLAVGETVTVNYMIINQ